MEERFISQIKFISEIDKLKEIQRQTYLCNGQRLENDAEHSWHLAMMAFVLQEYAPKGTDISKVMRMVLMHDLVEIYAGDTYCYDAKLNEGKYEREKKAGEQLYALLPSEQAEEYLRLWEEFEAGETKEAQFASMLDRLQPLILNHSAKGRSWKEHGVFRSQVLQRNRLVLESDTPFGELIRLICDEGVRWGVLKPE